MHVSRTTDVRSRNQCCGGKTIRITYYECLSVFLLELSDMQKRMRLDMLSFVARLDLPYFSS